MCTVIIIINYFIINFPINHKLFYIYNFSKKLIKRSVDEIKFVMDMNYRLFLNLPIIERTENDARDHVSNFYALMKKQI